MVVRYRWTVNGQEVKRESELYQMRCANENVKCKLKLYYHISRQNPLAKAIMQGTVEGGEMTI